MFPAKARYFPVQTGPYRMGPGLFKLGRDFGNGESDGRVFQRDSEFESFVREKRRILAAHPQRLVRLDDDPAVRLQKRALAWIKEQLEREGTGALATLEPSADDDDLDLEYRAISLSVQEDFALLHRAASGENRLVLLSVCFPSGWAPERLLGRSFTETHSPIPEFEGIHEATEKLVEAMISRGPYVRFVWSLTPDERLDHHPEDSPRDHWGVQPSDGKGQSQGYLRVERQLTVPFPDMEGNLFLIRTYLYPFRDLNQLERQTLEEALDGMSEAVRAYKGLTDTDAILRQLRDPAGHG